ncbi:MAG: hypothetical protein ACKO6Q_08615 [Bacteroidota bacterium]
MHLLEPFYNWLHQYVSEEDLRSPFYGQEHSEFEYSHTIYNYYIHPQWDQLGSKTLYGKVLMADYEEGYVVLELIGEWNDAVENDIMTLKRNVLEPFMAEGIRSFILIGENVLNFHSDISDYYEELAEELADMGGWIVCLNMPDATSREFQQAGLPKFLPLVDLFDWRNYKPIHLFSKLRASL